MKTPEQKLKFIVEKAGECWHEVKAGRFDCIHCDAFLGFKYDLITNPSPTDLNELMRLAEKIGYGVKLYTDVRHHVGSREHECKVMHVRTGTSGWTLGKTPAEALLNALFSACGGKE